MNNSVIPCHRGAQCGWPACNQDCDGRPGRQSAHKLDNLGRCCGRKPLVYKREPHYFCPRCDRAYSLDTGEQIANWAWLPTDGGFVPRYPDHGYAQPKKRGA